MFEAQRCLVAVATTTEPRVIGNRMDEMIRDTIELQNGAQARSCGALSGKITILDGTIY